MSDTSEMPADGGGAGKGRPDGLSGSPGGRTEVGGRSGGGESEGGAYPNPHAGKESTNSGMMGHGGQTSIDYHGAGQGGAGGDAPNAVAGSDGSDASGQGGTVSAAPRYAARPVAAGGGTFEVQSTNGVAEAEANGKIGTDAAYEPEQDAPGSS